MCNLTMPREGPEDLFLTLEMFLLCFVLARLRTSVHPPPYGWVRSPCLDSFVSLSPLCWGCSDSKWDSPDNDMSPDLSLASPWPFFQQPARNVWGAPPHTQPRLLNFVLSPRRIPLITHFTLISPEHSIEGTQMGHGVSPELHITSLMTPGTPHHTSLGNDLTM